MTPQTWVFVALLPPDRSKGCVVSQGAADSQEPSLSEDHAATWVARRPLCVVRAPLLLSHSHVAHLFFSPGNCVCCVVRVSVPLVVLFPSPAQPPSTLSPQSQSPGTTHPGGNTCQHHCDDGCHLLSNCHISFLYGHAKETRKKATVAETHLPNETWTFVQTHFCKELMFPDLRDQVRTSA